MPRPTSLALLALAVLAAGCRQETTQPAGTAADSVEASADQVIYGLRHRVTNDGIRKADLFSDTAYTRPNDPKVQLRGVRLSFFDANGAQNGTLTSRTGEYDMNGGEMIARGNAVLVMQRPNGPQTIRSEELHYDQKADRVWSTVTTRVEEEGRTATTQGFESDTRFQNIRGKNATSEGIKVQGGAGGAF